MSVQTRNINSTVLPNGIKLISEYMPNTDLVTIYFVVGVGSRNDSIPGISHLVEHMMFKGTSNRSSLEILTALQNCGSHNAYTTPEMTVYSIDTNKNSMSSAMEVIVNMLQNTVVDEASLENEKKIVRHEIDLRLDNIQVKLFSLLSKCFGDHKIASYAGGNKCAIVNVTREEVYKHIMEYYKPTNTTVIVTGNFDEDLLLPTVKSKTKTWHSDAKINTGGVDFSISYLYSDTKPEYVGGDFREKTQANNAYFMLGFEGASYSNKKDYLMELVTNIVLGGNDVLSPFMRDAREKSGLTYHIAPSCYTFSDSGVWGIASSTDNDSLNTLISTMIETLKSTAKCISADDVARARIMLKTALAKQPFTSQEGASNLLYECMTKQLPDKNSIITDIDAITHVDVMRWLDGRIHSPITVAAVGDIDGMYSYDEIVQQLHMPIESSA